MGHDEKGMGTYRGDFLVCSRSSVDETIDPAGEVGRVKLSGVKLYLDDGSNWNLITSA